MQPNGLKCNPTKTDVIYFYSRYMPSDSISHLRVGTAIIEPVNEVRDLGITLDSTLTLRTHINNICRSGSLSLHELSKIRKFLSQKDTERVVHAFISSKLDYCNGLFTACPLLKYRNFKDYKTRPPDLLREQKNLIISLQFLSICTGSLQNIVLSSSFFSLPIKHFMVWPLITWQIC